MKPKPEDFGTTEKKVRTYKDSRDRSWWVPIVPALVLGYVSFAATSSFALAVLLAAGLFTLRYFIVRLAHPEELEYLKAVGVYEDGLEGEKIQRRSDE